MHPPPSVMEDTWALITSTVCLWTPEEKTLGHKVIGLMELATVVFAC